MLDVEIKTIPHRSQRYDTAGDWYSENGKDRIRVSELGNRKYEALVAVHELIEMLICEKEGHSMIDVDDFDFNYKGDGDPGDDVHSPYRRAHCFATAVERMLCAALELDWATYESCVNGLGKEEV